MTSPITDLTVNPGSPTIIQDSLDLKNPRDLYRLTISRSSSARLVLSGLRDDLNLRVYRESNNQNVGQPQTNLGSLSEVILLDSLAQGTYIVEVALAPDSGVGNYNLEVELNTEARLSNLWWRNTATGDAGIWQMRGVDRVDSASYSVGLDWEVKGIADLDADGEDDIVWRNVNSGDVAFWIIKDGVRKATNVYSVGREWDIVAVDDLNGDTRADLVWKKQNVGTNTIGFWLMDGANRATSNAIEVSGEWLPQLTLDADGDTKADLFWRSTTGQAALWLMDGMVVKTEGNTPMTTAFEVGLDWNVEQIGDFNDDGFEDLLWRQTGTSTVRGTGTLGFWLMEGLSREFSWSIGAPIDWTIKGIGDFDGAGTDDILWNGPSGEVGVWYLSDNGKSRKGSEVVTTLTSGFGIYGVGDFNNDLLTDVVYGNPAAGLAKVSLLRFNVGNQRLEELDFRNYDGVSPWQIRGVLDREITNTPFDISGDIPLEWFDLGTLNDRGIYRDTVRAGESDYFRFNTSVLTKLTIQESAGVKFELARLQRDQAGNLNLESLNVNSLVWTTPTAGQNLESGDWVVRVATTAPNQPVTAYALDILGIPQITNIVGTRFSITQSDLTLIPSHTQNTSNAPNFVNVSFSVRNTGAFDIRNFRVGFWLSRNDLIEPATAGGLSTDVRLRVLPEAQGAAPTEFLDIDITNAPMLAGQSRAFNVRLELPTTSSNFWFVDGTHYIGMELDPNDAIPEFGEPGVNDNLNQGLGRDKGQIQISGTESTDLAGSSIVVTGGSLTPGGDLTITYRIQNLGNKATTSGISIPVQFFLSADPDINTEGRFDTSLLIVRDGILTNDDADLITPGSNGSAIGGAANGTPAFIERTVTLRIPPTNGESAWSGWLDENGDPRTTPFYLGMVVNLGSTGITESDLENNQPGDVTEKPQLLGKQFLRFG